MRAGLNAVAAVRADRRGDHEEQEALRRPHAEERLGGDDGGPDVERRAGRRRHPVGVGAHQRHDRLAHQRLVDRRDAEPIGAVVHPLAVPVEAEEPDLAVGAAERLEAVEHLLGVVEHRRGGIERKRPVGNDARIEPAALALPVGDRHVIGEGAAEDQLAVLGTRLSRRREVKREGRRRRRHGREDISSPPGRARPARTLTLTLSRCRGRGDRM